MSFTGDDEWDYERRNRGRRRPSPPPRVVTDTRHSQQHLNPNVDLGGLYRARSQGHGPAPNVINVYNDNLQDANLRSTSRSPTASYSAFPDMGRRRDRLGDELADSFADLAIENRRLRSRSRRRSLSPYENGRDDFLEYELRMKERELRERQRRDELREEEERIRAEYEARRLRGDVKRRADEDAAKDRDKRIIDDWERKRREDKEAAEEEEKRLRQKIEREKVEAKEKEEREWDE